MTLTLDANSSPHCNALGRLPLKKRSGRQLAPLHDSSFKRQPPHPHGHGHGHGHALGTIANAHANAATTIANTDAHKHDEVHDSSSSSLRYSKRQRSGSNQGVPPATKKLKQTRTRTSTGTSNANANSKQKQKQALKQKQKQSQKILKKKQTQKQKQKSVRTGRWTTEERNAFLRGLKEHGKGKWSKIAQDIPSRDTVQVKTHAQSMLRKIELGEDVFADLSIHEEQTSTSPCGFEDEDESSHDSFFSSDESSNDDGYDDDDDGDDGESEDVHNFVRNSSKLAMPVAALGSSFFSPPPLNCVSFHTDLLDLTFDAAVHAVHNVMEGDASAMNISPLTMYRTAIADATATATATSHKPLSVHTPVPNRNATYTRTRTFIDPATATAIPRNGKENNYPNEKSDDAMSSAAKILVELSSPDCKHAIDINSTTRGGNATAIPDMAAYASLEDYPFTGRLSDASHHFVFSPSSVKRIESV